MRTTDLFKSNRSSKRLNETLEKTFGKKINFQSFDTPKLEDARNKLRTQLHQVRSESGFNENLENDAYTEAQWMHDAIVAELMDREEHIVDNTVEEEAQEFFVMLLGPRSGQSDPYHGPFNSPDEAQAWIDAESPNPEDYEVGEYPAGQFGQYDNGQAVAAQEGMMEGPDVDKQQLMDILKRFDENMNEIGGYGDPDFNKILAALSQGDVESAVEEVAYNYADQDGGEIRSNDMDNYLEDLEDQFKDLAGGSDDEGGETDDGYALASAGFGSDEDYESMEMERVRDPEDWDEGNTEPANNFAVYINGKKWKVFKGRGKYADDAREKAHYEQLQDWAAKKSEATGKKWTVSITGENPTESIENEAAPALVRGAAGLAAGGIAAAGVPGLMAILGPILGIGVGAAGAYNASKYAMAGVDKLWDLAVGKLGGEDNAEDFAMAHINASLKGKSTFEYNGKTFDVKASPQQAKAAGAEVRKVAESSRRIEGTAEMNTNEAYINNAEDAINLLAAIRKQSKIAERGGGEPVRPNQLVNDLWDVMQWIEANMKESIETESVNTGDNMTRLREGEIQQASAIVTAKTMVDRVGRWIEELSGMENDTLLQLGDSIRDEMGQEQAKGFIEAVAPAIQQALENLKSTREALASGVRTLTGEEQSAGMLGAEPAAGGDEMGGEAGADMMNTAPEAGGEEDAFAAAEPAAGGAEEAGREQRESIQFQGRLLKVLAG